MSMDLSKIEKLYTENLEKFGIDSRSVGWNSPESQALRFRKLLEVVEEPSAPFTINELGCGYGELFRHCIDHHFNLTQFNGFDISRKMLDTAKQYITDPRAQWIEAPALDRMADYSFTSGIFNVKFEEQKDRWEDYMKDTLRNLFAHSSKGFAFNVLSKYVDWEEPHLFYADPLTYFDFCKRELSKKVSLLHDYPLYEWTIYVRK